MKIKSYPFPSFLKIHQDLKQNRIYCYKIVDTSLQKLASPYHSSETIFQIFGSLPQQFASIFQIYPLICTILLVHFHFFDSGF